MKHTREFEIAWQGLTSGEHIFEYEIGNDFMQEHGEAKDDIEALSAKVTLRFDKKSSFFMCHFDIDGKITVPCDRCGDSFEVSLWDEFDLVIKLLGENEEAPEEDADVVYIPRSETVIDISKWIYEFVLLSIPLQRIHPEDAAGISACNPKAIALLNNLSEHEAPANSIWKGLEGIKIEEPSKKK